MNNIKNTNGGDITPGIEKLTKKDFGIYGDVLVDLYKYKEAGLHNFEGVGYTNDDISKTFEQKFKENPNLKINDLFKHFCQPMKDYYNELNKSRFGDKSKSYFFNKNDRKTLVNETLKEGLEVCKNLPKDAIFLTFKISPLINDKSIIFKSTKEQMNFNRGIYTKNKRDNTSFLKPSYIGAKHVLNNIMKIFNITSVEKFIEVLKNLQRISFYNCPSYDEWLKGTKTLKELCDELNDILDAQRGTYGEDKLPKPSYSIKNRAFNRGTSYVLYTSVMLVGIYNDSVFNLSPEKKYCWLKNDDGQIIDGEFFSADMHAVLNNNKEVVMSYKNIKIDKERTFNLMLYDMKWAGLKLGRIFNKNRYGSKGLQTERNLLAYEGLEDESMYESLMLNPYANKSIPRYDTPPPPPPPPPLAGGKTKRKYKKSKKKKIRKYNKSRKL